MRVSTAVAAAVLLIGPSSMAWGQRPGAANQPAPAGGAKQATAPAPQADQARRDQLPAVVIDVVGTVDWAAPGVSVLESKGWRPVKVNDRLEPGTQLRTGLRSSANLKFGETSVVSIRSATHASIDQLYRSANTEVVRIGLAYGTVRGGSTEGTVRSDVVVDSTVATLAKRGTEGWQMQVEPMTGRFKISLAEYGLVDAIKKLRTPGRSARTVRPGEYATSANIANLWVKQDIFDRNIRFYEANAVTVSDSNFDSTTTRGVGVVAAGGGSTLEGVAGRNDPDFVLDQISENFPGGLPSTTVFVPTAPVARPEGHFGTGQTFKVLLPQAAQRSTAPAAKPLRRP